MELPVNFKIDVNKYQTPVTRELLDSLPEEAREEFLDIINNVPYVQNLISPNRRRAKDMPRDNDGKIIIDFANPHILENMDYFRESALHFQKYGCYTFLKPNPNPNSEYKRWIDEEKRRCLEGYVRKSDGEWVTGYMYFYINYCPIMLTKIEEDKKKAFREEDFPEVWEGVYLRFHYLHKARESGSHAIELARRGAHPYFQKVFTPKGWRLWKDISVGDKLFNSYGGECTVTDIPYDKETPYYKIVLRDGREVFATDDHLWDIIKKGKHKTVSTKWLIENYKHEREKSVRIPTGIEYNCFIPKNKGVQFPYKQPLVDAYTFGLLLGDCCFTAISCYYTQAKEDMDIEREYIPYEVIKWKDKYSYKIDIKNWGNIKTAYNLSGKKSEDKHIPDDYKYNTKEVRLNLLRGLLDSDGYVHGGVPVLTSTSKALIEDTMFIARSLGYNTKYVLKKAGYKKNGEYRRCLDSYELSIYAGPEVFNLPRKKNKVKYNSGNAKSRRDKTAIINIEYAGITQCKCVTVDSLDSCYLVGDFIKTHNCGKSFCLASIMAKNFILGESKKVTKKVTTILTAYQKEFLANKDGTLSKFEPMLDFISENTEFPRLRLRSSSDSMFWQRGYLDEYGRKKGSLNTVMGVSSRDDSGKLRGKRGYILFEEIGAFKNLINVYDTVRHGMEEGDYTYGLAFLVGTTDEKESNFESAKTLLYSPSANNLYALKNVYDKPKQGRKEFGYFFPAYVNRKGCYNKDGVSDVVKSLVQVLRARHNAKVNSTDPNQVLRFIAEMPITPAEAIMKVKIAYFPIAAINERILQLDSDEHAFDDVYIGTLVMNENGKVIFATTDDEPIRKYKTDNTVKGALEIFSMPENNDGKEFQDRYVIGLDPVNNDQAESSSLMSFFVFDLFTDRIVAEYTGRPTFADDGNELVRLACLFYNAKCLYESNIKGTFSYFQRMGCTHLLADTPEYLRDKQIIKYSSFGSSSKGVSATAAVNNYANGLIRDWLIKTTPTQVKSDKGEEIVDLSNVYTIRNRALLEELAGFDNVRNFDRVRALGMVMLYREEKMILYGGNITGGSYTPKDYLGEDNFFKRNYGGAESIH